MGRSPTDDRLRGVMQAVTDRLLERMQQDGFYVCGEKRYDPTTWGINNGYCEEWATRVVDMMDQQVTVDEADDEGVPFDGERPEHVKWWTPAHIFVKHEGRFYDAECHEGVDRIVDLPLYRNAGKSREQVLQEREAR